MRRSVTPALGLIAGAVLTAVFYESRGHHPAPEPFSEYTRDIVVRHGIERARYYRPYGVIRDGRRVLASDGPDDPAAIVLFHFDGGRLQVACTEVPPPPIPAD